VLPAFSSTPNPGPGFEAEDQARHAGPSNYLEASSSYIPQNIDREQVDKLFELVTRPNDLKDLMHRTDVPHYDQVWTTLMSLTKETRNQLPVPLLKRVLRQVAPPIAVVQQALVAKRNATNSTESEISSVTEYPWEPRLQLVASILRFIEERDRTSSEGMLKPEERAIVMDDYLFVLRQFALTGHLAGSERVFKEMKDTGIPLPVYIHDTRLMVLTKWLTIRKSIYQRFIKHQAEQEKPHVFGVGQTALSTSMPFFPPDAVELFKQILVSMREDQVVYRQLTYDLLFRIAKETKNDKAADKILKLAYNVDLAYPDNGLDALRTRMREGMGEDPTGGNWELLDDETDGGAIAVERPQQVRRSGLDEGVQEGHGRVRWNKHALNTLVRRFAERGDLKGMLQAFEVFGQSPQEAEQVGVVGEEAGEIASSLEQATEEQQEQDESTSPAVEDEPITLTEAMAREEASGQRLDFFGRPTHPKPSNEVADNNRPKFPVRPAAEFLPTLPFPLEIETRTKTALEQDPEPVAAADLEYSEKEFLSNTDTYRTLIQACAVQASLATDAEERDFAMTLGVHFLRGAVREMIIRHNAFLAVWVRINAVTADLKMPAPPPPRDDEVDGAPMKKVVALRQVLEIGDYSEDSPLRRPHYHAPAADLHPIRSTLRKRLAQPSLTVAPELVLPLYKVLRSTRNLRSVPSHKRWLQKHFSEVQELGKLARRYGREEWKVLTGKPWEEKKEIGFFGRRRLAARQAARAEEGTIEGMMQSLQEKDERLKEGAEKEKEASRMQEEEEPAVHFPSTKTTTASGPSVRSGSTLPPAFFSSDLAAELHVPWTWSTSPFSSEPPVLTRGRPEPIRFVLSKHMGILREHGRELERVMEEQEAGWETYKQEKMKTKKSSRKKTTLAGQ
jgi:hypothetical protein